MLEGLGLLVGRHIGIHQPQLAILHGGVTFGDIRPTFAQRFHLGPFKDDAAFDVFFDSVIKPRAAVFGDHLVVRIGFGAGFDL